LPAVLSPQPLVLRPLGRPRASRERGPGFPFLEEGSVKQLTLSRSLKNVDPLARFRVYSPAPRWVSAQAGYTTEPPGLAERLRFEARFDNEVVELFQRWHDGRFLIPRGLYRGPMDGVDDCRSNGIPYKFGLALQARDDEQARVIAEGRMLLRQGESFILQSPTGSGKSVIACAWIHEAQTAALVVVPKDDLVQQWRDELARFLALPVKKVGVWQQDKVQLEGRPVVVGSLASLAIPGRYPPHLAERFGLVVFDEVHRLGAPEFSRVAGMFPARLRVGLSATPDRKDGKELLFQAHIGPVAVVGQDLPMTPRVLRYRTTWRCPRRKTWDGSIEPIPHAPGKVTHVIKSLVKHQERNGLLTSIVKTGFERGRRQVVFTELLGAHAESLRLMFLSAGIPESAVALYAGTMRKAALEAAAKVPVIIATYGKMAEGTNIPELDMAVFATPRADVRQTAGRVLRYLPGKRQPVLIDLLDDDSWVFESYAKSRLRWYRSIGAEVKDMA